MCAEAAFLAGVLAVPDDDVPRLVYADWLEEHAGSVPCAACTGYGPGWLRSDCTPCRGTGRVPDGRAERAEFIRVQCRIAAGCLPDCSYGCPREDCTRCVLRRRERELFGPACFGGTVNWGRCVHYDLPGTPDTAAGDDVRLVYRRGFVEVVACMAADWLAHGPAVVACQPVREATLSGKHPRPMHSGRFEWVLRAWRWEHNPPNDSAWDLPPALWPFLPSKLGRVPGGITDHGVDPYGTEFAALAALSAACLAYARDRLALDSRIRGRVV